ncbi:MAG: hypothetical protein ACPHVL_05645 [Psychroflexus salarius]
MKNLEKHIKSKIEQREIQPSEHAWFKVVEGLEQSPQRKKRPYLYFIAGLVAGLVLFFSLQTLWFSPSNNLDVQPTKLVSPASTSNTVPQSVLAVSSNLKSQDILIKAKLPQSNPIHFVKTPNKQSLYVPETTEDLANSLLAEIELELQEQPNSVPKDKLTEVDRLLAQAKAQLQPQQRQLVSHVTPELLLADVNAQLEDDNFRDKVWAAIKLKFNQVQEALTQR